MRLSVTPGGVDLLLHCLEGGPSPVFTAIVLGNGENAGSEATEVSNPIHTFGISNIEREEGSDYVTLQGRFNNADINERFLATETGILVQDPDNEGATILFAYAYVPREEAPVIPAAADYAFETTDHFIVYVGKAENVSAIIAESMNTVSRADFDAHVNDYNNPHRVDKRQIGLDQVENTSPENTVVDFTEEENLSIPVTGEITATFFQKTWTWLKKLKAHLDAKNPHRLSVDDIGAAKSEHTHSTTDMISGVLSPTRGGTGVNSFNNLVNALVNQGLGRICCTSYIGTGAYGLSNLNSLSFPTAPKMILVQPQDCYSGKYSGFMAINGVSSIVSGGVQDDVANTESRISFYWESNMVSWYNRYNAMLQCNAANTTYIVLAIL